MSPPPTSSLLELQPHPSGATAAGIRVFAACTRRNNRLLLNYEIRGDLDALHIPAPGPAQRQDGLWQTTCLEAFIHADARPAYREYNFAPSGAWACYAFSEYRGQPQSPACDSPQIERRTGDAVLQLSTRIPAPSASRLQIGLSAVLEDRQGRLSYWALHHPVGKPDFHHPESFVLALNDK